MHQVTGSPQGAKQGRRRDWDMLGLEKRLKTAIDEGTWELFVASYNHNTSQVCVFKLYHTDCIQHDLDES